MAEFKFNPKVTNVVDRLVKARLSVVGEFIKTKAQDYVPFDEGRLHDSLSWQYLAFNTIVIGTNVDYGWWQEVGTRRMSAQPFMMPALFNHKSQVIEIMSD